MMHSPRLMTIADKAEKHDLRSKFLACAIPARSFAMGANPINQEIGVGSLSVDLLMNPDGLWPKKRVEEKIKLWFHSDYKNLAYLYVYPLFKTIVDDKVK
jgi:hypothetical protein